MKLLPLLLLGWAAAAHGEPVLTMETLTAAGKTYRDVAVTEKRADGVTITHAGGVARIPYERLPGIVRYRLGGFDAQAARIAREEERATRSAIEAMVAVPADEPEKATAPLAAPRRAEPRAGDKLFVKPVRYGGGYRLEITGRAGALPLRVAAGAASFTVPPWQTVVRTTYSGNGYRVRAYEGNRLVDTETSRHKTGLGSDYKLR